MQQSVQKAIQPLQTVIGSRNVRWVPPENLHLTLKFLGDTSQDAIPDLKAGILQAAIGMKPFELWLAGVGCFPNARKPRVIWMGIQDKTKQLATLHDAIEKMAQAQGFDAEDKPFRPHLTLARVKGHINDSATLGTIGRAVEQATVDEVGAWPCTAVSLMASELTPDGSIYTCLDQSKFG